VPKTIEASDVFFTPDYSVLRHTSARDKATEVTSERDLERAHSEFLRLREALENLGFLGILRVAQDSPGERIMKFRIGGLTAYRDIEKKFLDAAGKRNGNWYGGMYNPPANESVLFSFHLQRGLLDSFPTNRFAFMGDVSRNLGLTSSKKRNDVFLTELITALQTTDESDTKMVNTVASALKLPFGSGSMQEKTVEVLNGYLLEETEPAPLLPRKTYKANCIDLFTELSRLTGIAYIGKYDISTVDEAIALLTGVKETLWVELEENNISPTKERMAQLLALKVADWKQLTVRRQDIGSLVDWFPFIGAGVKTEDIIVYTSKLLNPNFKSQSGVLVIQPEEMEDLKEIPIEWALKILNPSFTF
jgi:hypothetical protein